MEAQPQRAWAVASVQRFCVTSWRLRTVVDIKGLSESRGSFREEELLTQACYFWNHSQFESFSSPSSATKSPFLPISFTTKDLPASICKMWAQLCGRREWLWNRKSCSTQLRFMGEILCWVSKMPNRSHATQKEEGLSHLYTFHILKCSRGWSLS